MEVGISFNYIQLYVLFSFFYVGYIIWIVYKMYHTYHFEQRVFHKGSVIHRSLFQSFIWMEMANLSLFVLDNLVFRLPSTGLFSALCASLPPNHFLKIMYMLQLFTNYYSMFYSFLFCLTRFIIVFFSSRLIESTLFFRRLCLIFVPFTFIFPLCADFYLIPSLGYCRLLKYPFPVGANSIGFKETLFNIRTDQCLLYLNFILPGVIMVINGALIYKVRALLFHKNLTRSRRTIRAQWSLTLTTLAIMAQFLTIGGKTLVTIALPAFKTYASLLRNPILDFGMVLVPLIFYLSHPMFHVKPSGTSSTTT